MPKEPTELIKVPNYSFDKGYFGMPSKRGKFMYLDRPLFITPYAGIASIFAVARCRDKLKYPEGPLSLGYTEWGLPGSRLQKPLDEVHIFIKNHPEIEPYVVEHVKGYVYEIDVTNLKDHIYRYEWMTSGREFLIVDLDKVEFANVIPVDIKCMVYGGKERLV